MSGAWIHQPTTKGDTMERWTEAAADDMRALLSRVRAEGGEPLPISLETTGSEGSTAIRGKGITMHFTEREEDEILHDPMLIVSSRPVRHFVLIEFIPEDGVVYLQERKPKPRHSAVLYADSWSGPGSRGGDRDD